MLKHVSVAFEMHYEVTDTEKNKISSGIYCKFTCEPYSESLHRYFIEVLAATASVHGTILTQSEADSVVNAMLELFRQMENPPNKTVIGLWGELLTIEASANPAECIDAWHISGTDTFDFAFSSSRLEVKATERATREHDFALAQVRGGRSGDVIASVMMFRSPAGITALGLAHRIAVRVPPVQQQKLWMLVLGALGADAEASDFQAFDLTSALSNLRFIPASAVPAPNISKDNIPLVFNVRFRANIDRICDQMGSTSFPFRGVN